MGVWRRHRAAAGFLRLVVIAAAAVLGACGLADSAAAISAAAARAPATNGPATSGPGPRALVVEREAELARASARVTSLAAAVTALQTRAEALTEDYDHEVTLAQQAAAAYQVAAGRLTIATRTARRDGLRLAQQAAADYEADGGPGMAVVMLAGAFSPQAYLGALGTRQVMASQRADLVAASQADELVTRLFAKQAATTAAQRRAASRSADDLRLAVEAAVSQDAGLVKRARAARSKLAAELASARASEAALAAKGRAGRPTKSASAAASLPAMSLPPATTLQPATEAGGPSGAAPGVVAPDWSPDAGASASQGNIAANWALTQLGKPYQWGGAGPGSYDCSGLAMDAWAGAGVVLYHWTGFQWVSGPHVPLSQLRRGDLVFYATNVADPATIHHVGIYIGGGRMVDAPYTGAVVRIDSIYAYPGLIGATRPAA